MKFRLFGTGDQFMVDDDKLNPGETPKDDMIFHSFTYVPDKKSIEEKKGAPWVGTGHEKSLNKGDKFKAKITNIIDPKNPVIVDLPTCEFVHVRFYNAETGADDKTHKDIAITFDIIDPPNFLEKNPSSKFLYSSFGLVNSRILSKSLKISATPGVSDEEDDGKTRITDLVISSDKSIIFGQKIIPDKEFLNSLLEHHIDQAEKNRQEKLDEGQVTGTDLDASGKKVADAAERLGKQLVKTADAVASASASALDGKTVGGKKRKTYRKKSSKKYKKKRTTKKRITNVRNKKNV
jgi:hypothetical protein